MCPTAAEPLSWIPFGMSSRYDGSPNAESTTSPVTVDISLSYAARFVVDRGSRIALRAVIALLACLLLGLLLLPARLPREVCRTHSKSCKKNIIFQIVL
jgi:hypothetical protein